MRFALKLCVCNTHICILSEMKSCVKNKKSTDKVGAFWLGNRDSNPNKQSQSLSCYRYTIPQCNTAGGLRIYIIHNSP